jgi:hypothetical protein
MWGIGMPMTDQGIDRRFEVRPIPQAMRESRVDGDLGFNVSELKWVVAQLRLLEYWPLTPQTRDQFSIDLDCSTVTYDGLTFNELRLEDASLRRKNLRVFFWVQDSQRVIWIIHGYWKKSQRLGNAVLIRVANRIHHLRGTLQDGRES